MTLLTRDQYKTAPKQVINYTKTASRTTIAGAWFTLFDLAGLPAAGSLSAGNTSTGLVPVSTDLGYPPLSAFTATGELGAVSFGSNVACRIRVFDCLFAAGAFAFNANITLSTQPSFATRVPGGYANQTQIWYEQVTAATGNPSIAVTYNDQGGATDGTTGTVALGLAPTIGRCLQLPFTAGDSGCQLIKNVTASVATVGTFNIRVLRPLWTGRVKFAGDGDMHAWINRAQVVFADRPALYVLVAADSTSSGIPDIELEVCNG